MGKKNPKPTNLLKFCLIVVVVRILNYISRLFTLPSTPHSENTLMLVIVAEENQLLDHAKWLKA